MKGSYIGVVSKHLIVFHFETNDELKKLMKDVEEGKMEAFFSAKANINADVVIGRVMEAVSELAEQKTFSDPNEAPTCPKHHKDMLPSKFGGWYCPNKDMNDYCKISVTKDGEWKGIGKRK